MKEELSERITHIMYRNKILCVAGTKEEELKEYQKFLLEPSYKWPQPSNHHFVRPRDIPLARGYNKFICPECRKIAKKKGFLK